MKQNGCFLKPPYFKIFRTNEVLFKVGFRARISFRWYKKKVITDKPKKRNISGKNAPEKKLKSISSHSSISEQKECLYQTESFNCLTIFRIVLSEFGKQPG